MCEVEHQETTEHFRRHRNQIPNIIVLSLLLVLGCLIAITTACSAALPSAAETPAAIPASTISLSPGTATVASLEQVQFTAHVSGKSRPRLTWSASAGTISSTGVFTAPKVTSTTRVTITATSSTHRAGSDIDLESSEKAMAAVTVTPPVPSISSLAITNSALPQANASVPYSASLSAVGGVAPYTWSLISGSLPQGIQLQSSTGAIQGTTSKLGSYPVSVQVTDASGRDATAGFSLTVIAPSPTLAITSSYLPPADASVAYSASLSATGGVTPYQWSLASGSLPSGLQLQSSSGMLKGTTSLTGTFPLSVQVTDASGNHASAAFSLTVSSSSTTGFDGPAELPRTYIQSAMSNTPAPGKTTTVNAGGDLQAALNNASCGDTIQLQSGATFLGNIHLPGEELRRQQLDYCAHQRR